jgi:hypothetical protein
MKNAKLFYFLVGLILSLLTAGNLQALTITATGSGDFTLPSVNMWMTGFTTSSDSIIDDIPVQGDFRVELELVASETYSAGNTAGNVLFLNTTYDPSSFGAIDTIDFTFEGDKTDLASINQVLVLRQSGLFYDYSIGKDNENDGIFTDLGDTGLAAIHFRLRDDSGNVIPGSPDFSSGGGLIEIGLGQTRSTNGTYNIRDQEVQNFSVTITSVINTAMLFTEKSKVSWHHDDLKVQGRLQFPEGIAMDALSPVGSAVVALAEIEVADQSVSFEIAGKHNDKWHYKDKHNINGNIKEFKIDWKESKFDYKGDLHLHTHANSTFETTFCIHTKDVTGAFMVDIDGTTIAYDEERNITTELVYEPQKDDNSHVHFSLPFELIPEMIIEVTGAVTITIPVADYYQESYGKFKLVSAFDPISFPEGWQFSPETLEFTLTINDGINLTKASDLIDSWEKIDEKHWENK